MTTPDHRLYLAATDLRTAEDVARWLDQRARTEFRGEFIAEDARELHTMLVARLDRERRQACRRGARYEITMARAFWRAGGGVQALLARAHVERAFAFRAAARTP